MKKKISVFSDSSESEVIEIHIDSPERQIIDSGDLKLNLNSSLNNSFQKKQVNTSRTTIPHDNLKKSNQEEADNQLFLGVK